MHSLPAQPLKTHSSKLLLNAAGQAGRNLISLTLAQGQAPQNLQGEDKGSSTPSFP